MRKLHETVLILTYNNVRKYINDFKMLSKDLSWCRLASG